MANDRFFIRCTLCGDYLGLGKWYPSVGAYVHPAGGRMPALETFFDSHLTNCQPNDGHELTPPICLVIDNEATLCAAGGLIGGSGNTKVDTQEKRQ